MRIHLLAAGTALALLAAPIAAQAQSQGGAAAGATTGAVGGAIVGGPVGAVVGAGVGAVVGLAADQQPRFRQYVVTRNVPSYRYADEVRVGAVLPSSGVTYYEVPAEYGVRDYRYTVVNDRVVLVDPRSHRVVQVIQ